VGYGFALKSSLVVGLGCLSCPPFSRQEAQKWGRREQTSVVGEREREEERRERKKKDKKKKRKKKRL
jgi:hypothetical protein